MGDFVSSASSSQATDNEQTAVQGGTGSTTATGVKGTTASGSSLALGDNSGISHSDISIQSSDPATVAAALNSVDNAVDANAYVSNQAITASAVDTEEAYAALENEQNNDAALNSQAVTTAATVSNNAQNLAYGQAGQPITSATSSSSSSKASTFETWLWIGLGFLGIYAWVKTKGKST